MDIFEIVKNYYTLNIFSLLFFSLLLIGLCTSERIIRLLENIFNRPIIVNVQAQPEPPAQEIPECQIPNCSNIYQYLLQNAPLFTVIGITGTMLSLLPNFLEKFISTDWKMYLLSNFLGLIALIFILIFLTIGGFFIVYISAVLLNRLRQCNFDNHVLHTVGNYTITRGNVQKIFFQVFFIPMIIAFCYLIIPIFMYQDNPYIIIINFIIIIGLILLTLSFYTLYRGLLLPRENRWKNVTIFFYLICWIIILLGFFYVIGPPLYEQFNPNNDQYHGEVRIQVSSSNYSISDSKLIGFPFNVEPIVTNVSQIDLNSYLNYHWTTNYGYFVSSDYFKHSTKKYGQDYSVLVTKSTSPLYWTYDISDQGKPKPPVIVYLTIENVRTNQVYNGTQLNLTWRDMDTIIVENESLIRN